MNKYYTKTINTTDRHDITVDYNDNIIDSKIECVDGGFYSNQELYNKDFIGKGKNYLRGKGFKKVKGPSVWNQDLKQWRNYTYLEEEPEEEEF